MWDLSCDKIDRSHKKRRSKESLFRYLTSSAWSEKGTWSIKGFLAESVGLIEKKNSYLEITAPKLKVLYEIDNHFRGDINYENYSLLDKFQILNGKMAVKTGK